MLKMHVVRAFIIVQKSEGAGQEINLIIFAFGADFN